MSNGSAVASNFVNQHYMGISLCGCSKKDAMVKIHLPILACPQKRAVCVREREPSRTPQYALNRPINSMQLCMLFNLSIYLGAWPSLWAVTQQQERWCCSGCCTFVPRWPRCLTAPACPAWQRCSWPGQSYHRCLRLKPSWWFWPQTTRGNKSVTGIAME